MCQQMSLKWLKTNMEDIAERAMGQVGGDVVEYSHFKGKIV
jgi:hypothetical protein